MAAFLKVVSAAAKYGKRAVDWVWGNKGTIMKWLDRGLSVGWIIDQMRQALGL